MNMSPESKVQNQKEPKTGISTPMPNTSSSSATSSVEGKKLQALLSRLTTIPVETLNRNQAMTLLADLRPLLRGLKARQALSTFPEFCREILEMQTPKHFMEWSRLLHTQKEMVLEAARDHSKSWTVSRAWPLFHIQRVRDQKDAINIALISYAEDQSRKNLSWIRKRVETHDLLRWLVPTLKSYVWEAGELQFSNGSTIECFGFGSSIRGGHYHKIIIDDPTKDHWTMSIEEQINFLFGVILPALRRGGQLIITGNPVDKKDLLEHLEVNKQFPVFKYPALNDKNEPLWPEQYTLEDLMIRRSKMPVHIWAREFMLKRVSAADSRFKESMIHRYKPQDLLEIDKSTKPLYRIMTIDPAISPGGDALAAVVTGTDSKEKTYVLDRMSHRGDLENGVSLLCDMMERNSPDFIGFENFAFQKMYKIWLEKEMEKRGLRFTVSEIGNDTRKSKAMRIEALQPKLAQGTLLFREEDQPLIDQLLLWDPLSKVNDDDEIDALAWQVTLWDSPSVDARPEIVQPGSFQEAIDEIRAMKKNDYMESLFGEHMH